MATRTAEPAPAPADVVPPREATASPTQANPLREGLRHERIAEPCTMIICGATGDLTERKLAPALYNCFLDGFLPRSSPAWGSRDANGPTISSEITC
jgi:glucose-6-phosphate dehydrogenase-like protein